MSTVARIHYEIPDELHRQVKAEAAMRGQTLKDFVITALEGALSGSGQAAARPREAAEGERNDEN